MKDMKESPPKYKTSIPNTPKIQQSNTANLPVEGSLFASAYREAKKAGKTSFVWNGKPYSTDYAGTPRQEVGAYGVNGKTIDPFSIINPIQINRYNEVTSNYIPGHIEAGIPPSNRGEFLLSLATAKGSSGHNYDEAFLRGEGMGESIYAYDVPYYTPEKIKSGYNLLTNNCADAVCSSFNMKGSSLITTPRGTMSKIKSKYPTINVEGRTHLDYHDQFRESSREDRLKNSNYWLGISNSPDMWRLGVSDYIRKELQQDLIKSGYTLPKSTKQDGSVDGVMGPETLQALKSYNMKKKNSLPVYDFGSWLGENAVPLATTIGGAAMLIGSGGLAAPVAAPMIAGGIGMAANGVGQMASNALTPDQTNQPQQLPTTIANKQYAPTFALGGPMPQAYEGQSHLGPNGGIPIDGRGNPSAVSNNKPVALVEGGEVSWMSPQGTPYIFSDKLGFAKQAKSIMGKYKMRLGDNFDKSDKIALTGLNGELANLMNKQEVYKQENGYHTMPDGSTMSNDEMGSYCMGGKVKYGCGGNLPKYADGGFPDYLDFSNIGSTEIPAQSTLYPQLGMSTSFVSPTYQRYQPAAVGERIDYIPTITPKSVSMGNSTPEEYLPSVPPIPTNTPDFTNTIAGNLNPTTNSSPFGMGTADYLGYSLQAVSPLANLAMTLANKPKEKRPSYIAPETINLEAQREALRREATTARNINNRNARGGSFYNYYSNSLAGGNAAQRALGEGLSQSYLGEETTNMQSRERAKGANLEQDRYFENLNSQEQGAYLSNLAGSVGQIGQFGAGFMRDRNQMKSAKMYADNMGTDKFFYDQSTGRRYSIDPLTGERVYKG